MDQRLLFGLGVSAVSLFIRWRFPTLAKPIGTSGTIVGLGLILWSFFLWVPTVYAVACIAVAALLASLIDWLVGRAIPSVASSPSPVDQSVSSIGQRGGITAHTVNIDQAPAPEVKFGETTPTTNADGSTTFSTLFEIISPYPPGALDIKAIGQGITELDFGATSTGMLQTGHQGFRDGFAFNSLISPFGKYYLVVRTTGEMPQIEYSFR